MAKSKTIFLALIFCGFLGLAESSLAAESKLSVKSIHRISHPAYNMANVGQTASYQYIWNVDYSRVLMYESGVGTDRGVEYVHPNWPTATNPGRGAIWGCISSSCVTETAGGLGDSITSTLQALDLANAAPGADLVTAWKNNTIQLPWQYAYRPVWSPYAGETNIIYALKPAWNALVKYNVDTGVETHIEYYNIDTVVSARIVGFAKNATVPGDSRKDKIYVDLNSSVGASSGNVVEIFTDRDNNFANPTAVLIDKPQPCDEDISWYPNVQSIHSSASPDGVYAVETGGAYAVAKNNNSTYNCFSGGITYTDIYWNDSVGAANRLTHTDWGASNDWYISSNSHDKGNFSGYAYNPVIGTGEIYQVEFDRAAAEAKLTNHNCPECFTHNLLISRYGPRGWFSSGNSTQTSFYSTYYNGAWRHMFNYHAALAPTVSKNGLKVYFHGTGNDEGTAQKYTRDDKYECVLDPSLTNCSSMGNNWEGRGAFIAELTYDGNTVPPAAPSGLNVQ